MNRFENQLVVVTGAAQGIGRAIAEKFLSEGATVILGGRTAAKVEAACREIGSERAIPFTMDVADDKDWKRLVDYIQEHFDGLDVLVNNAAVTNPAKTVLTATNEEFDREIKTNLYGPFYGIRECYRVLKKGDYASIVNIGSFAGLTVNEGSGNDVAYQSSKAALRQLTRHAAINLAPDCIRVNIVHPGGTLTPMVQKWLEDLGKTPEETMKAANPLPPHFVRPAELADAVVFLADRNTARAITGAELSVDSGAVLL